MTVHVLTFDNSTTAFIGDEESKMIYQIKLNEQWFTRERAVSQQTAVRNSVQEVTEWMDEFGQDVDEALLSVSMQNSRYSLARDDRFKSIEAALDYIYMNLWMARDADHAPNAAAPVDQPTDRPGNLAAVACDDTLEVGVRLGAARNRHCPPGALAVLADDLQLGAAISHICSHGEEGFSTVGSDFSVRTLFASHPNCPARILDLLAHDPHDMVAYEVACNPNCPPDVLSVLAGRYEHLHTVTTALTHPNCPPATLAAAAATPRLAGLRRFITENPRTPPATLGVLSADADNRSFPTLAQAAYDTITALSSGWNSAQRAACRRAALLAGGNAPFGVESAERAD